MNIDHITKKAIEEIEHSSFGVTEQFLAVHNVVYIDGKCAIKWVDVERDTESVYVYFSVENEPFYFVVVLSKAEQEVTWVYVEEESHVHFIAVSEELSANEIRKMTSLEPSKYWSKGERKGLAGKSNKVFFEPTPEPLPVEQKINRLLDFLETDLDGVKRMVEKGGGYIQVVIEYHNGNTMLGGFFLNTKIIKRLASLNIEIDFDLYAVGNFYKDE